MKTQWLKRKVRDQWDWCARSHSTIDGTVPATLTMLKQRQILDLSDPKTSDIYITSLISLAIFLKSSIDHNGCFLYI